MSKRFSNEKNVESPAKRFKSSELSKDKRLQNATPGSKQNHFNDVWGDDFGEEDIEVMDFIASQATQEEPHFATPQQPILKTKTNKLFSSTSTESGPSTSSGSKLSINSGIYHSMPQSQIIGGSSNDYSKEILECTQAIRFDDFESNAKSNISLNSTFRSRQDGSEKNSVLVSDDQQLLKLKQENQKLLEDFMTKEGETEFLRQQLHQMQTRNLSEKKKQTQLMDEQMQKLRMEISGLLKEKNALESQLQLQSLQLSSVTEKSKLRDSGSVKFTTPQMNHSKSIKDRSNTSNTWSSKKIKSKDNSTQVDPITSVELLKTSLVVYPLKVIPKYAFEPSEPEKSVIDIKIEEKIGKRNLAILQEEETFRIFENPELSKPKVTMVENKVLSSEFFLPDLAKLMNKTFEEINSSESIPILNKLISTARELLLNSTIVLKKISQALQNDDIRDMNELYLSEFYNMPVLHTNSFCEAAAWYDLERGVETRRALGVLAYVAEVSEYLAEYVAGNHTLKTNDDSAYAVYIKQMTSYQGWDKKNQDFEFLDLILEFITIVGSIRRSHQFSGVINSIMRLIINSHSNIGFSSPSLKRVYEICKEIIYSRPLLTCFIPLSELMKEFSNCSIFVSNFCIMPETSGINLWKGSLVFSPGACALEIFINQLENFKLDQISIISITKNLAKFINVALLNNSIPWLEKTMNSCNCCLNVLKYVMVNLCECSKINVDELKEKYSGTIHELRDSTNNSSRENHLMMKNKELEKWKIFEKEYNGDFWNSLKLSQYSAISYGIRLLSYVAKRDSDFLIRLIYIEHAFHIFLQNLDSRMDLKLKKSDEIALDIVKQIFVLEKLDNREPQHVLDILQLENERWRDVSSVGVDLKKLYDNVVL